MKHAFVAWLGLVLAAGAAAEEAGPATFRWRAPLELPATTEPMARVAVPAAALAQLQQPGAADLRVFDAAGRPVPFAFVPVAPGAPSQRLTRVHPALAMAPPPPRSAGAGAASIDVQSTTAGVRVRIDPASGAAAAPAGTALFDLRAEKERIAALEIDAVLPAGTPVDVQVSLSADLARWTAVPVRGPLYRFDGEAAPANTTLAFAQPLAPEGRFLRLTWDVPGAAIRSVTGRIDRAAPPAEVAHLLGPGRDAGTAAREWELPFATPLTALAIAASRPGTLVPVRVLGRNDTNQPWRTLAAGAVYRLGSGSAEATSPPLRFGPVRVRWLRVEATHGQDLQALAPQAQVVFEPLELAFVVAGPGPYQLAAGRPQAQPAALPLSMLAAVPGSDPARWPLARVGAPLPVAPPAPAGWTERLQAVPGGKQAVLWAVLLAGVLLLGGVAWSLMRSLNAGPAPGPDPGPDSGPKS